MPDLRRAVASVRLPGYALMVNVLGLPDSFQAVAGLPNTEFGFGREHLRGGRMQIVDNVSTTLRAIGKDEQWLQDWIAQKPARLGLGDLTIKKSELIHYKNRGGRL